MIRRFLVERHLGKTVTVLARTEDVVPRGVLDSLCWPQGWGAMEVRAGERLTLRVTLEEPPAGTETTIPDSLEERAFDKSELMFLRESVTDLTRQLREGEAERLRLLHFLRQPHELNRCEETGLRGRCGLWRGHDSEHLFPL